MKQLLFVLIFLVHASARGQQTQLVTGRDVAVATTSEGKVRGYINGGIYAYKGIPYATAERFMKPRKPEHRNETRSSLTYGPVCPLINTVTVVQDEIEFVFHHDWGYADEDCLRLNIWTPSIAPGKKRPVMVWLHGGGFSTGSSQELPSYDGESLARTGDVVVVSVNHRLNILGFLNLAPYGEQYRHSANAGMLDVVAALEWVRDNIGNFGGDPGNVTLFGQSGGGGKVNTLLHAPSARGLFHKAIIQSGGTGMRFLDATATQRVAEIVLAELKLRKEDVDSLRRIPYPVLAAAGRKAIAKVNEELRAQGKWKGPSDFNWAPTVDGFFLTHHPRDPEARQISSGIPVLIGSTKNEFLASLRFPQLRRASMSEIQNHLQPQLREKTADYIAAVKKTYPATVRPSDFIDIDDVFRRNALKMADNRAANKTGPVYMYLFTWQSPVMDGDYKAIHCMDLPFVFNNIHRCAEMTGGGREAYDLAAKMSQAWINFARTGDPNHAGLPKWTPYTPANGATMIFDTKCEERYHPDREILAILPDRTKE